MTDLKQRIAEAYETFCKNKFKEQGINAKVEIQSVFEAGFLAGIEDTAKRVIQSNDDVISEIDAIVGRTFARIQAEKALKTSNQA